jgi:hypothetical protein
MAACSASLGINSPLSPRQNPNGRSGSTVRAIEGDE